jgi:hypothetical protein
MQDDMKIAILREALTHVYMTMVSVYNYAGMNSNLIREVEEAMDIAENSLNKTD